MRILALLLALVLAPQAALARVAAFPETALRGDREISAFRVSASARQLADGRQETACFYDSTASAMTDDPINHRDPTGTEYVGPAENGVDAAATPTIDIDDLLTDAGTNCTVGACTSEVDMSQMECLRTLGFAAGAGFCAVQPEACVALSAASACMSSGASEEDALVLTTAMVPEVMAGLRAGQSLLKARQAERLAGIKRDPVTGEVLSVRTPRSQAGMLNINLLGKKVPSAKPQRPSSTAQPAQPVKAASPQPPQFRIPKSGLSGAERASDIPEWARGNRPFVGENGKAFAKRLLDAKYGPRNHDTGPGSEFSKLKKFGDRGFEK